MPYSMDSSTSFDMEEMWSNYNQGASKASHNPLELLPNDTSNADWTILETSQWPEHEFGQSSLSSTGDPYALQEDSWSPVEDYFPTYDQFSKMSNGLFNAPEDSYFNSPTIASLGAFDINWSPDDLTAIFPWADLPSPIEGEQLSEKLSCNNFEGEPPSTLPTTLPSPTALIEPAPETAEGRRRSSESSKPAFSRAIKNFKRTKKDLDSTKAPRTSKRRKPSSDTSTAISTTTKKPRSNSQESLDSPVSQDSRSNHNLIEKQYRNRLNVQFESLLETLPKATEGEAGEKRVGKAEVLVLANQYIQELEEELRVLEEKNDGLEGCVEGWKIRWMESGGLAVAE